MKKVYISGLCWLLCFITIGCYSDNSSKDSNSSHTNEPKKLVDERIVDNNKLNSEQLPSCEIFNANNIFSASVNTYNWMSDEGIEYRDVLLSKSEYIASKTMNILYTDSLIDVITNEEILDISVFNITESSEVPVSMLPDGKIVTPEKGEYIYKIIGTFSNGTVYYLFKFTVVDNISIKISNNEIRDFFLKYDSVTCLKETESNLMLYGKDNQFEEKIIVLFDKVDFTIIDSVEVKDSTYFINPIGIESNLLVVKNLSNVQIYDFELNLIDEIALPTNLVNYIDSCISNKENSFYEYDFSYLKNEFIYVDNEYLYYESISGDQSSMIISQDQKSKGVLVLPTFVNNAENIIIMLYSNNSYIGHVYVSDEFTQVVEYNTFFNIVEKLGISNEKTFFNVYDSKELRMITYDVMTNLLTHYDDENILIENIVSDILSINSLDLVFLTYDVTNGLEICKFDSNKKLSKYKISDILNFKLVALLENGSIILVSDENNPIIIKVTPW